MRFARAAVVTRPESSTTAPALVLASDFVPPARTWSGQAGVIARLLAGVEPARYAIATRTDYGAEPYRSLPGRLGGRYLFMGPGLSPQEGSVRRRTVAIARYTARMTRLLRRESPQAVVAAPDRWEDLPAVALAARLSGTRFFPYLFDDYAGKWLDPRQRRLARRLEPLVLRSAAGIIVPNEFLEAELRRRHGLESTVVRNVCDLAAYEHDRTPEPRYGNEEVRIVFTGAIYHAHHDAFRTLLAGLEPLQAPSAVIHAYTGTAARELDEAGVRGRLVVHAHREAEQMPSVQRSGHILFLPLAFRSPYPDVVRTSAPAKMAEYLAARRPVLVHAPPDSFVSHYFRRHECGLVVDRPDPAELRNAVRLLAGDAELRERLARNAWERARTDFDPVTERARLLRLLDRDRTPP